MCVRMRTSSFCGLPKNVLLLAIAGQVGWDSLGPLGKILSNKNLI